MERLISMNLFLSLKKKFYRWVSKDRKTKFRINSFSSEDRIYEEGSKKVYADIKKRFYNQFLEAKKQGKKFNFSSDMLAHYKKGHTKFFFNVATLTHGVPIKCKKHGLKRNNNCIERDHQYSRKLEKNSRGNEPPNRSRAAGYLVKTREELAGPYLALG